MAEPFPVILGLAVDAVEGEVTVLVGHPVLAHDAREVDDQGALIAVATEHATDHLDVRPLRPAAAGEEAWKVQMAALLALCRSCSRLMESGDLVPPGCVRRKEAAKGLNRQEIKASQDKLAVWMAGR